MALWVRQYGRFMLTKKMSNDVLSKMMSHETSSIITSAIMSLLTAGRCRFTPGKVNYAETLKALLKSQNITYYETMASAGIIIGICYSPEAQAV